MLSSASRFRARGPVVLSTFLLAAVVAACMGGAASAPGGNGDVLGPGAPAATAGPAPGGGGGGGGEPDGEGIIDQAGLLIVKTGALAIQVGGLDAAMSSADQLIGGLGGYASASERFGDEQDAQASVTYRIPVARWADALGALRALGDKVIDERYSTDEVTAQVVDLGARITNLRSTEAAFQAIMDRAVDIEDVLRVQSELTTVRSEIERLTAQRTNLEGQAAFSTLTVTFSIKSDPVLAEQQGFDAANEVEKASATLVGVLQALATAGIWFGIVWLPILLTFLVIGLTGSIVYRRMRRNGRGPAPAIPTAGA